MDNPPHNDIRRALTAIRSQLKAADAQSQTNVLRSLLDAGDDIVVLARKLTLQKEPHVKELANKPTQPSIPKPPGTQKTKKAKPKSRKDLTPIRPKPPV